MAKSNTIRDLMTVRLMSEYQVRRLPVTEEDGRLVGIVSQRDLALHASNERIGETVSSISA